MRLRRVGSSPRMRGKPDQRRDPVRRERIIPAHAGQTPSNRVNDCIPPDHPRACGANVQQSAEFFDRDGSSPRMRGKRVRRRQGRDREGSSPRMRGKRPRLHVVVVDGRIIPAHAGQTGSVAVALGMVPDHPRACGANQTGVWKVSLEDGSSPRMRGKLKTTFWENQSGRIIPAHAGQTRSRRAARHAPADHPRACGANRSSGFRDTLVRGSSPRMRGKLLHW